MKKNPIQKAEKYLASARQILLQKGDEQDDIYEDRKIVRRAGRYEDRKIVRKVGRTAYRGAVTAINAVVGAKSKGDKSIEWYVHELRQIDQRIAGKFESADELLRLSMGCDGNGDVVIVNYSLSVAEALIDWAKQRLADSAQVVDGTMHP